MNSTADFVNSLGQDLFPGFALCLYIAALISLFRYKETMLRFELDASKCIGWWGFIFVIVKSILWFRHADEYAANHIFRMVLLCDLWILIPGILLGLKTIRSKRWLRLLLALPLLIPPYWYEKFVIIATSQHRDYLPSSWTPVNLGSAVVLSYLFSAFLFFAVFYCWKLSSRIGSKVEN